MNEIFRKIAKSISYASGSAYAFILAVAVIVLWASTGPYFNFSNTWQLVINTTTTITTFLMVFIIQNTQNRDSKAVQLKLDELIRAVKYARMKFIDLEDMSDEELKQFQEEFEKVRARVKKPKQPAQNNT